MITFTAPDGTENITENTHSSHNSIVSNHSHLEEPPPEPAPPTEGVQLDLGLPETGHEVAG